MKYVQFRSIDEILYGEVFNERKYYSTIKVRKAFIKKEFPYFEEISPEHFVVDIYFTNIIREVSEEEYLAAMVLDS